MLLFGQKQNEIHAGLIDKQYTYLFLDNAIYNDFILIKRRFCNKETNHAIPIAEE